MSSSAIRAVAYDERTLDLQITFTSGSTYTYYGVPAWKYAGLINASSAGQYFNDNIRDQHSSNRFQYRFALVCIPSGQTGQTAFISTCPLTLTMIRRLREGLGIPAESLIKPRRGEAA